MTELEMAMRIEHAFRRFSDNMNVSHDLISRSPTVAIENGLNWVYAQGFIGSEDLADLLQIYNFGSATLNEVMKDHFVVESLQGLIQQLNYLRENK